MIIGVNDKVEYVARIADGEVKKGVGTVLDVGEGILEVKDDATGIEYSVWACDANVILGERQAETQWFDKHYSDLKAQPMDSISEWPVEQQIGFYRGSILKYIERLGHKDEALKEARKILRYAQWLVTVLEGKKVNPRE